MDIKRRLEALSDRQKKRLMEMAMGSTTLADTHSQRLVAFVQISESGPKPSATELKTHLSRLLPDYCLPNTVECLGRLPLTSNGKVDKQALVSIANRAIAKEVRISGQDANPLEAKALNLWREFLHNQAINIDDDFFDSGGDSLLAIKLVSRMRQIGFAVSVVQLFKNPTIRGLLHDASQSKPVIPDDTEAGAMEKRTEQGAIDGVKRKPASENACLSYAQEGIWLLEQQLGPSPTFNTCSQASFRDQLDVTILRRSIEIIVDRQESLRTRFEPRKQGALPFPILDRVERFDWLTDFGAQESDSIKSRFKRLALEPMDLEQGPLFQCFHARNPRGGSVLLAKMHHMITDGLSYRLFYDQLIQNYLSLQEDGKPISEDPQFQYTDFSFTERLPRREALIQRDLEYWKSKLAEMPPALEMPTDFPRPAEQSYRGASVSSSLSVEVTKAISNLARDCESTEFNVILAAFAIMLHRNSRQSDILIGVPTTNRNDEQFESTIGLFINMAPLRLKIEGGMGIRKLIRRISASSREILEHNHATFERIVREVNPDRDQSRPPVFQTAFIYDSGTANTRIDNAPKFNEEKIEIGSARHDLTFEARHEGNRLSLSLEYCQDLFDESTASGFLKQIETCLSSITIEPQNNVIETRILNKSESLRILKDWNDTGKPYPSDSAIQEFFSKRVEEFSNRIAATAGGQSITYSELESKSNQLARFLVDRGFSSGQRIAVLCKRSIEMLVSMLGTLKAGCAYVPLDSIFPDDRIRRIIEDSGASVMITDSEHSNNGYSFPSIPRIAIDRISSELSEYSVSALNSTTDGGDLAYVIYTSGSTGIPKGVAIEHRAVCNFLLSMQATPGMSSNDVLLAVTTISFDIACLELFLPLICGARVVIADPQAAADGRALQDMLTNEDVTIMQATPATWRLMLATGWKGKADLRILCGGEAMHKDLAAALIPRCKELWNMYGPTETTIWSTCERVRQPDRISIGRPIANTQTFIVDENNAPVPVGVEGELLIAGDGLARGYWGNDQLSKRSFIANPFNPDTRAYRTGDLARWLNDGRIECLGRADSQVKVRGFRIEPEEIESRLTEIRNVNQALVAVQDFDEGDQRLAAFLVVRDASEPIDSDSIKTVLSRSIPDYMIPSIFAKVDRLPLTPNGKIDRNAAPKIDPSLFIGSAKPVPPRTPLESTIATAMARILHADQIGIQDNFFRKGGHSLLALQLLSLIEEKTGVQIPLRKFFEKPNVEGLAIAVTTEQASAMDTDDLERLLKEIESSEEQKGPGEA